MNVALELLMLAAAYLLAAMAPTWRWWGALLIAAAVLTGATYWSVVAQGSVGALGARIVPLLVPAIAGASGGLVVRAITLLLGVTTRVWAIATAVGLVATATLGWLVF